MNVSSVWKTDHGGILIKEAEARLYYNFTNMKILIQRLIDDENISNGHADGI